MIRRIFSIAMMGIGGFLEIWYYNFRFLNDGVAPWLSIVIGMSLTLLLALSVFNRKRPFAWILMIALLTFSVLSTSAGQSFSLGVKQEKARQITKVETYQTDEIGSLIKRRQEIDKELSSINDSINRTVYTLEDRAKWRSALKTAEERKIELTNERNNIATELKALYDKNESTNSISESSAVVNIYDFYSGLFGIKASILQLILHSVLSIFIAIMAPIGLITYPQKNDRPTKPARKKNKRHDPKGNHTTKASSLLARRQPWVERWVKYNWIGVKSGSKEILSRVEFDRFAEAQGYPFTDAKYKRIYNAGNRKKILDKTLILCYDEGEAIEKIMEGIREKKEEKKEVEQKGLFE